MAVAQTACYSPAERKPLTNFFTHFFETVGIVEGTSLIQPSSTSKKDSLNPFKWYIANHENQTNLQKQRSLDRC